MNNVLLIIYSMWQLHSRHSACTVRVCAPWCGRSVLWPIPQSMECAIVSHHLIVPHIYMKYCWHIVHVVCAKSRQVSNDWCSLLCDGIGSLYIYHNVTLVIYCSLLCTALTETKNISDIRTPSLKIIVICSKVLYSHYSHTKGYINLFAFFQCW